MAIPDLRKQPQVPLTPSLTAAKFTCQHCHKAFSSESSYLGHKCKQMRRLEEAKTPNGQLALYYYQLWMRQQKRMPPPMEAFMTSKYFRTFLEFVKWSKVVELAAPDKFIWLMVHKGYPPTMWRNDEVYSTYLEFMDRKVPPLEQAKLSIRTLLKYCDRYDIVDISTVFQHMDPTDIIQLIRTRKLSAWLLLFSKSFRQFYTTVLTVEQRMIVESLIKPDYWAEHKSQYPADVAIIKTLIAEMGI